MDMIPKLKLESLDWIDDGARDVMAALNTDVGKAQALFVGGCVRNAVMGRGATDIDIATIHTPEQVTEFLTAANIKVIPTGVDHGTVTAVIDGIHYEITTLRRDVETTGRHAVVRFSNDWREDVMRRDFTMNTLLCDLDGNVFDPIGTGVEDAIARRILFVGDAGQRIQEDYLRILRFFRFHCYYGVGQPDAEALNACKLYAPHIASLSKERIAQELLKIIAVPSPYDVLILMRECGILPAFFSAEFDAVTIDRLSQYQITKYEVDVVCRLVALGDCRKDMCKIFADTMTLSNKQQKRYHDIVEAYEMLRQDTRVKEVIYRMGNEVAAQAVLLVAAVDNTSPDHDLQVCKSWSAPRLPVSGEDIMAAGIEKGPEVGRILRELEEHWLQKDFAPDKENLLARIK